MVGVRELTKGLLDDQRRLDEELTAENLGLLHGNAVIEPGGSDEDGEFSPANSMPSRSATNQIPPR